MVAELASVTQVPPGALFRQGEGWAVYVIDGDMARARPVTIGERIPTAAEVRSGLSAGDAVVVYPPDTLTDGARVVRRNAR